MALPALLARLSSQADIIQRLLAIAMVWGSLFFAWGTIAERALTNRLPPVQQHLALSAAEVGLYLSQAAEALTPLVNDTRLVNGLMSDDGLDSRDTRRAMYEFSYLNRLGKVWIYNPQTQASISVPGAGDLPEQITNALPRNLVNPKSFLFPSDNEYDGPQFYIARTIPDTLGQIAIVRLSFQNLMSGWPRPMGVPHYPDARQGFSIAGDASLFIPYSNPSQPEEASWLDSLSIGYARGGQGYIWVWEAIPNQADWFITAGFSYAGALGEGRHLQMALLFAALGATLYVLWWPTRHVRRAAVQKMQPLLMPAVRLLSPTLQNLSRIIKKESEPSAPLAVPGRQSTEDFEGPKKFKLMNLGSITAQKKKPALASQPLQAPALSETAKTQPEASPDTPATPAPDAPPPPPTAEDKLTKMIERALTERRIQLLYQPIFDLRTGETTMHEVLARLSDDQGHWMLPETFIPILAKNKWLPKLDALVFMSIYTLYQNPEENLPRLCLNVSGTAVEQLKYLDKLSENEEHKAIANHLIFEVSSSELMTNPKVMKKLLALKELGVKLSVDYFGGGRTMMQSSHKLGFDFIKLNAAKLSQDDHSKKELISLALYARQTGIPMVLEKIETVSMEVLARKAGIPFAQGYQLARPTPTLRTTMLQSWKETSKNLQDEDAPSTAALPTETPPPEPPSPQG